MLQENVDIGIVQPTTWLKVCQGRLAIGLGWARKDRRDESIVCCQVDDILNDVSVYFTRVHNPYFRLVEGAYGLRRCTCGLGSDGLLLVLLIRLGGARRGNGRLASRL